MTAKVRHLVNGDARRFGSGLSMILAPLLLCVSSALGPPHEASRRLGDLLPHIAAGPDRFLAFVLVSLLSLALMVPAALGVAHLLRPRKPLLALTGAVLLLVGILASAVVHGVYLVQHQMIHAAADRAQMVDLLERLEGRIGLRITFVGFILGLLLGWVILSAGLVTGDVPRAIPIFVLASLVLNLVGLEMLSRPLFLIGLGWLGLVVILGRDDGWLSAEPAEGPRA